MPKKRVHRFASLKNEYGLITVSESLVATIVGLAASECYGVVGMVSRKPGAELGELLKKDHSGRGVIVEWIEGKLEIQVFVVVGYGTRISEVANNIIRQVQYAVEKITGLTVAKVKVFVQGVKVIKH